MSRLVVMLPTSDQRTLLAPLRADGHAVQWHATARDGVTAALASPPDLVFVDAILPDGSALAVCRELKAAPATRDVPVVVVSASGAEIDRVVSLELGAEDFVVRPYSARELVLRVRAILRRRRPTPEPLLEAWGGIRVDRAARRLWVEEREVALTATEWRLFIYLFDARERVRTRAELLRDIWSLAEPSETRSVDAMVARLRDKLGTAGARLVTVRGVGYRLSLLQDEAEDAPRPRGRAACATPR